jgi:putative peptide zinc metalloprotease protein
MLHKMRPGPFRLGYGAGAVALAIFAQLAVPGTASAGVSTSPLASPQPATYVNLARATSLRNFYHAFTLRFQLQQGSPSGLNANNSAVALTANCHDCGALAIAFQVVFVTDQDLTAINANNNADATSYACVRCTNTAEAYQIIVATDEQSRLTDQQERGLAQVRTELEALQQPGLDSDQIQSQSDALANQAVSILDNPAYGRSDQGAPAGGLAAGASTFSPAINASALPAALTESTQPLVELHIDVKSS